MAVKKIPPLDLMFYLTETAQSPKHVGAVQIFKMPAKAPKTYMRDLVKAFKDAPVVSPFDYRPHFPRIGMPEWVVDDDLDIEYHVRHSALPQPGTDDQLLEVLQRLHCGLLNRDRPGWICQIIEGLEGGRFAIYSKIHHSYIDGMSGVKRIYGSLSPSPGEIKVVPTWSYVADEKRGSTGRAGSEKRGGTLRKAVLSQAKAATELYSSFTSFGLEFFKPQPNKAQSMFRAPHTRMNKRVEYDTRAIATCTLSLEDAHAVGAKYGGKVNDVVLAVIDAALHDYLKSHDENTEKPLVALCPMSIRLEGDDTATTQATALHVRLGAPGATIQDRLQQVIESSKATKEKARAMSREALMDLAMVMVGALELIERSGLEGMAPSYNVLVSNVPGPSEDVLYLRGSRQLSCYPISAFLPGSNLNVTVLSHGDKLDFGLVADKHALPDLQFVAREMEKHFTELAKGVPRKKSTASRAKTRKTTRQPPNV